MCGFGPATLSAFVLFRCLLCFLRERKGDREEIEENGGERMSKTMNASFF
jgi:hypothetical protein